MKFILSFILSYSFISAFAQTATISGRVLDSKTLEPLPFANVFINYTTMGTATDEKGYYKLNNIPVGQNEVIFSFVGYQSYQTKVELTGGQQLVINAKLVRDDKLLDNVQVQGTRDKEWDRQLKKFIRAFLGTARSASHCKIINPWVLEFKEDKEMLAAEALDNLYIENDELGYTISYTLKKFITKTNSFSILGNARFEEMKTSDESIRSKWARNRIIAYEGSQQHLFKAILNHSLNIEGFILYNDKIGFENSPRSSVFARELGHSIELFDTTRIQIFPDPLTNEPTILLKDRIEVHYTKSSSRTKIYDDVIAPVSWIDLKNGSIKVNSNGIVLDPENIVTSGYISSLRIADMLPINYKPDQGSLRKETLREESQGKDVQAETLKRSYEKIYIHTDKSYYYPGERMWFKAYVNYNSPTDRDFLSKTLYVELINPSKEIILEKILRLDSGFSSGDFILPDSVEYGNYYLRSYTQLQRNFGDENLFMKVLPVVKLTDKPVYMNEKEELPGIGLKVVSDKASYKTRDKITLTLELEDHDANPSSGNFSISVTDASLVLQTPESGNILEKFLIKNEEIRMASRLNYLAEDGFTVKGQFLNNKGKGEKTVLNVVQLNPYQLFVVPTDDQGYFEYMDLHFYDEAPFWINSVKGKGKPYGRIKLLKHDVPPVMIKDSGYNIQITNAQTVQRIFSEYEKPVDSKMLEEVVVQDRQNAEFIKNISNPNHPYGEGDYVFKEDKIKTQFPNLLYTLQSLNISGLIVNPYLQIVYFARHAKVVLSAGYAKDFLGQEAYFEIERKYAPLVTLDGTPLSGPPGEALMMIDPNTVGSIEVTKRQSTIRGSLSPYGVIAVFTKTGYTPPKKESVLLLKVQGYNETNQFTSPNYGNSDTDKNAVDYRSTLYWNPSLKIEKSSGTAQVSFYASDLSGPYRVVVEGINSNGEPIRSVSFIEVKE